ncbi:ATP-binding protein, partial [Streptomyces sp. WELS2]|uniref:ATP-binding protein n=1 Tax=Streptomyces sp. WELS2 TaxID=2749435 RepID=UPI00215D996F
MRHRKRTGRFPVQTERASTPWRGAKEVSGVALVVAQEVPTSSSMAVPHGPAGVGEARHRMRAQLRSGGVAESVIDDAVLILSELLSNACRHGRPLGNAP